MTAGAGIPGVPARPTCGPARARLAGTGSDRLAQTRALPLAARYQAIIKLPRALVSSPVKQEG